MHHDFVEFIIGIGDWFNIQKSVKIIHYISRLKKENCMIISREVEKHLTKFNIISFD